MTVSPASSLAAQVAWNAAFVATPPMPPGIAIDHVQDETGDREDAIHELVDAAANYLEAAIPSQAGGLNCLPLYEDATLAVGSVRGLGFGMVATRIKNLADWSRAVRNAHWRDPHEVSDEEDDCARRYTEWAKKAMDALAILKAIEDAA